MRLRFAVYFPVKGEAHSTEKLQQGIQGASGAGYAQGIRHFNEFGMGWDYPTYNMRRICHLKTAEIAPLYSRVVS